MDMTPQLRMLKPTLDELPALVLPAGFTLRSYQAGDSTHWERILAASFGGEPGRFGFDQIMRREPAYRPERVLFVVANDTPVATASAWRAPGLLPETGMVHFVGVVPEFQGHRLGYWVTLATLHRMAADGLRAASLTTDEFRLPAVKTYLRMGFEPVLVHENQRERWRQVFRDLKLPEAETRFAALLCGPVWQPPVYPADEANCAGMVVRRRRQHPDRPVGQTRFGECDTLADESLYRPALLGRAGASVSEVVAGADLPFELWFEAGPAGLPTGSEILFHAAGWNPLGTSAQDEAPERPGFVKRHYAGTARLNALPARYPPAGSGSEGTPAAAERHAAKQGSGGAETLQDTRALGFVVEQGALAPGERVTLSCGARSGFRWTSVAGRQEIKVLVNPGLGEPAMRLPEPVVIRVVAGAPAGVEACLPGSAAAGEALAVSVRVIDRLGNSVAADFRGRIRGAARTLALPLRGGRGRREVGQMGIEPVSCRVSVPGLPAARSNVTVPRGDDGFGLYFGDLLAPAAAAAGGTDDLYRWARQEKQLDFVSLVPPAHAWLDNEQWALHKRAVEANLDEGHFVTFLGFAWRHSCYGDKVVHFLGGDQPYLPVDDPRYAYPARLYEALRATDALVVCQDPGVSAEVQARGAGWAAVEPDVERLVQMWSTHGLPEGWDPTNAANFPATPSAADRRVGRGCQYPTPAASSARDRQSPRAAKQNGTVSSIGDRTAQALRSPPREADVMAALRAGLRLGFTGGSGPPSGPTEGCGHEPRPGAGGLCAVWAERLTRRSLFAALLARRTYAVSGRRIVLRFTVNGAPMGAELPFCGLSRIRIQAWAEERIVTVEVARNAAPWRVMKPGKKTFDSTLEDTLDQPAFYHARVTLADGSLAVCSPVWIG